MMKFISSFFSLFFLTFLATVPSPVLGVFPLGAQAVPVPPKRNLVDSDVFDESLAACKDESYELEGYIENNSHFVLIAAPLESNSVECKEPYVFDDMGKERGAVSTISTEEGRVGSKVTKRETFPLGKFSLGDLAAALDAAPTMGDIENYDLLSNNCATFILGFMEFLKIPVTKDGKRYVVNDLAKNKEFIKKIREDPKADAMLAGHGKAMEELSDEELMWHLVTTYAKDHYDGTIEH